MDFFETGHIRNVSETERKGIDILLCYKVIVHYNCLKVSADDKVTAKILEFVYPSVVDNHTLKV